MCVICNIKNKKLLNKIEDFLDGNQGILTQDNRVELSNEFEEFNSLKFTVDQLKIHWNFHQTIKREACGDFEKADTGDSTFKSLANDIDKDEGDVLSELLNSQAATFNCLTNKINKAIEEHNGDLTAMVIHPNTAQFYNDLAGSIRSTVKELRELNIAINGAKDGAMEGLKALARALHPEDTDSSNNSSLVTHEYD